MGFMDALGRGYSSQANPGHPPSESEEMSRLTMFHALQLSLRNLVERENPTILNISVFSLLFVSRFPFSTLYNSRLDQIFTSSDFERLFFILSLIFHRKIWGEEDFRAQTTFCTWIVYILETWTSSHQLQSTEYAVVKLCLISCNPESFYRNCLI